MFWFPGLLSCQSLQVPHHCLSLSCLCCFTNRAVVLDSGIAHGTVQCVALVRTIFCIDVLVSNARPQSLSWTLPTTHVLLSQDIGLRLWLLIIGRFRLSALVPTAGNHRRRERAHASEGTAHPPPGQIRATPPRQAQGQREPGGDPHQGGAALAPRLRAAVPP